MIKKMGILLLAVMLAAFFSGCVSEMSADQIVQKMKERQDSIRDFSATMAFTMSFAGQNIVAKAKIMNKMPDKTKVEYIEPSEAAGQVVVRDGTIVWTYDPKTNTVMKEEMEKTEADFQQDYMEPIRELLDKSDITYLGTDNFEGRTVYRITAVPKNESALIGIRSSLWVDSETLMPLKIEISDKDDNPITSFEYRDVKINTGIPDSEFEFKAPPGAKVVT